MKILHVVPSLSPLMGGSTQAVLNLVRALRQNGVDAEIATTNYNGRQAMDVPLGEQIEYEGVPARFFQTFIFPMKEFLYSTNFAHWLNANISDYQLLHNHYLFSFAPSYAGGIARAHGIPYIVRTLGHLNPWALRQSQIKKKLYLSLIERPNLNRAAAIHCTSAGEVNDVSKFAFNAPVVNIPLGVHIPQVIPESGHRLRHRLGIPEKTPVVLFLARLHPKKRPDLLLRAFSGLLRKGYSAHLVVVGEGEKTYVTYLKALADSLTLNRILFTGFLMGEEKDLFLQGADLFVLPSHSENFGISVAEAMAAGLPVVITPEVQIAPEITNGNAGLVVEGTVEAFSSAMEKLLNSEPLRRSMGFNGRELAGRLYSWGENAEKVAALYTSILEKQLIPRELCELSH